MRQQFQLNTKGCCFICLTPIAGRDQDHDDGRRGSQVKNNTFSIHNLCRHLGLNVMKVFSSRVKGGTSTRLPSVGKSNVKVQLCERCGGAAATFSELFQQLEFIRMEMEHCLEGIQKLFEESDKDTKLVGEFNQVMASDIQSLLYLGVVDELRREVAAKCSIATSKAFPRVRIRQFAKGIKLLKRSMEISEPRSQLRTLLTPPQGLEAPSPAIPAEPSPPPLPRSPSPEPTKEPEEPIAAPLQCYFCGMNFSSSEGVTNHFNEVHLPAVKATASAQVSSYLLMGVGPQPLDSGSDNPAIPMLEAIETPVHDPIAPFQVQMKVTGTETSGSPSASTSSAPEERSFKCGTCGTSFMFQSNLQTHLEVAHVKMKKPHRKPRSRKPKLSTQTPRNPICSFCKEQFSSEEEVCKHVAKDHLGSVTSPVETSTSLPREGGFHSEGQMDMDDNDPEIDMDMINPTEDPLETDPLSDLNLPASELSVSNLGAQTNSYQCKFCLASYTQSSSLSRHKKNSCPVLNPSKGTETGGNKRNVPCECDICHQRFSSILARQHHQSVEHDGKTFGCDMCPQTFWNRSAKYTHKPRCPGRVKVEAPFYLGK